MTVKEGFNVKINLINILCGKDFSSALSLKIKSFVAFVLYNSAILTKTNIKELCCVLRVVLQSEGKPGQQEKVKGFHDGKISQKLGKFGQN